MSGDDIYRRLDESAREVREYAGTDCARAVARHLAALEESYLHDLRGVSPEKLTARQAALSQVTELQILLDPAAEIATNGAI